MSEKKSDLIAGAVAHLNEKLAGGGLEKSIAIEVRDEGVILIDTAGARAEDGEADCRLIASAKVFAGLVDGSANAMTQVMLGRLKVRGDASAALKLGGLLG